MDIERRRAADLQLGHVIGVVEGLAEKLEGIENKQDRLEGQVAELEKRVTEKFTTVETTFKVLKFVGLVAVAIITLKWGEVSKLWDIFF